MYNKFLFLNKIEISLTQSQRSISLIKIKKNVQENQFIINYDYNQGIL